MKLPSEAWEVLGPAGKKMRHQPVQVTRTLVPFPHSRDPRWYIPVDSRAHAAGSTRLLRPYSRASRVGASLFRLAASSGLLRLVPGKVSLKLAQPPAIECLLSKLTGKSGVRTAIYAGRSERKRGTLVALGLDAAGECVGVARVATDSCDDWRVKREAETLRALAQLGSVPAPALLWSGEIDGRCALIQAPMAGTRSGAVWSTEHDELIRRLEHGEPRPLAESAVVTRLVEQVQREPRLRQFHETLTWACTSLSDVLWRPVVNHGDFAPWNVLRGAKGELTAIDWEYAEIDGLPLADQFYFELAVGVFLKGWTSVDVSRYARTWPLRPHHGLPATQARALLVLILLERIAWRIDQGVDDSDCIATGCSDALSALGSLSPEAPDTRRRRVLLSAYACEPGKGSEPGVGWNWALQAAKDHDVWVLTRANNRQAIEAILRQKPAIGLRFIYVDLPEVFLKLKKRGLPLQIYYVLWQAIAFRRARTYHRRLRFDIVHHVTMNGADIPGLLWMLGAPFVWGPVGGGQVSPKQLRRYFGRHQWAESLRTTRKRLLWLNPLVRACLRRSAIVLAANADTETCLRRAGARVVIRELEAGTDIFVPPPCRGEQSSTTVLWAGGLIHRKAPALALDIVAELRRRAFPVRLLLAGDGPLRASIERKIGVLELEGSVELCGRLPHSAMADFYAAGSVFLFTSLQDTSGNVVLEAMAAGLPIVTLDHHGVAEIVSGDSGIKVSATALPEAVVSQLADAIQLLLESPELAGHMGVAARARVEEAYSWDGKRAVLEVSYAAAAPGRRRS